MRALPAVAFALVLGSSVPGLALAQEDVPPGPAEAVEGEAPAAAGEVPVAETPGPSIDDLLGPIGGRATDGTTAGTPRPDEPLPGPSVAELLGPAPPSGPEEPPPDEGVSRIWFWSLTGLAVAAGIGGGIAGGLVLGAEDDYDVALAACRLGSVSACADGPRIVSDFEDYRLATNILLFSAGGFALAAFVLAFFTDFDLPPPMDDTPLAPLIGLDSTGATLSWRF